jgi:hypothetical protein
MKQWLKYGLIGGLILAIIGAISAFTINHALEPSRLLLYPFSLNKITFLSPYSICQSLGSTSIYCVWTLVRIYAIILEFILGFLVGAGISFIKKSKEFKK